VSSELTRRVVFGVIAAPIAIGIVLLGGAPLAALLAIVSAIGAWELFRIARAGGLTPFDDVGIALAGIVPLVVHARYLGLYDPGKTLSPLSLAALVVLFLLAGSIWTRGVSGHPLSAVASTLFGIVYTGGMLSYGYAIRYHEYAFGATAPPGPSFRIVGRALRRTALALAHFVDLGLGHRSICRWSRDRETEVDSVRKSG
jgi:phosphatidate cytidylyltransferase